MEPSANLVGAERPRHRSWISARAASSRRPFWAMFERHPVTSRPDGPFDELAFSYSAGQVLEALSIRQCRGELPGWAAPHLDVVAKILESPHTAPDHVASAAELVCRVNGCTERQAALAFRRLESSGASDADVNPFLLVRMLDDWRTVVRANRPPPTLAGCRPPNELPIRRDHQADGVFRLGGQELDPSPDVV